MREETKKEKREGEEMIWKEERRGNRMTSDIVDGIR